ncbi:hypothetical protein Celal_2667 [Cellulophaga algicola DSM 14237]|uniref:Uncharacterized protein n=1 Tax=Cellulophaga algicola (strain DSM 14237 / IC166 / ACAM 630) TaxID=688270 RepID=E6XB88_CELAD|nr:DUF4105 domain-containing protein [Cellulophaga algicola]ADV49952.1 hypothetical protein Celal_2667 [Cellulophaga algicola DSM 14237]
MPFKKYILGFLFAFSLFGFSQPTLSSKSKISILTVGTADELYAKFGHSAIRVQDPTLGIDVVYNYGHFDFNTPNFYVKFTQGKLLYSLARESFSGFLYGYELENRWVREQDLQLTLAERNDFLKFLENNHLPENRFYKYDFLFDNCSTRIPDALKTVLGNKLKFEYNHLENQYTFRELIHQNLEINSWSNFGIDLALGSVIDKKATPWEHLFLPIYVYKQLPYATLNGKKLISNDTILLKETPVKKEHNFFLSPLFWLSLIGILVCLMTLKDYKTKKRSRYLDFTLFLITGLAGILIVFLWFGTDHQATAKNFNFLWTFPLNTFIAFIVFKKSITPKWMIPYLIVLLVCIFIAMLLWLLKVQIFSILIIPIVLALVVRYSFLIYSLRSARVH